MKTGKLFGIGVGPGDPGLLTVKAVETIKNADIIITPKTEKKDGSVAYNIARKYIPENVEILPMVFQMSNDMEAVNAQWKENRKIIAQKLDEGKNLVFLTLGDPMLYSTYMYIFNEFRDSDNPRNPCIFRNCFLYQPASNGMGRKCIDYSGYSFAGKV